MSQDGEPIASPQENGSSADAMHEDSNADGATLDKNAVRVNIDDIFGSEDEDDLLAADAPSSAPAHDETAPSSPPSAPISSNVAASNDYSDPNVMLAYYSRLFPFVPFYQWLNQSMKPSNNFAHREFAFSFKRGSDDGFARYLAYPTSDLFRKDVLQMNPTRIEIGPVYSMNPRDKKSLRGKSMKPVSKELVFDIDMTDYDKIRTCCKGGAICSKCWAWLTMAVKVIDLALRDDFGFRHILWVYSGRRGIHAWVSDKKAREMDDLRRKTIAGYLNIVKGGEQSGKLVNLRRPLHPHLTRSLKLLEGHFAEDVLEVQDPWREEERAEHLLKLLPDRTLAELLRKRWASSPGRSSAAKWADIDKVAGSGSAGAKLDTKALMEAKQDIVLEYTYPRLDAAVSLHLNHLLKSPFVVHPGTGRICVPLDPKTIQDFDPEDAPKVTELLGQIDEWTPEDVDMDGTGAEKVVADYEKTRLKPYVELFKKHAAAILREERGVKREREENGDPMEF